MFSTLRQNNLFYILDKSVPELKIGLIVSVSNPQPKSQNMYIQPMETVVDISVKVNEETLDFKLLPSSMTTANVNSNIVVSESKESMSMEVESMLGISKLILNSIDYHKNVIKSCDDMLRKLNPQFAKEKELEEKIGKLESKVTGMEGTLSDIKDMLHKVLNK